MKTCLQIINTTDPERVCIAIDELEKMYKDIKIVGIVKENLNCFIYYQIGMKSTDKTGVKDGN